jgi:hypothetical protein
VSNEGGDPSREHNISVATIRIPRAPWISLSILSRYPVIVLTVPIEPQEFRKASLMSARSMEWRNGTILRGLFGLADRVHCTISQ